MKIAQIAPLAESVPPKLYGGTERVISYLTEALVRQGQEVTLFASADSRTAAELVSCAPSGLRLSGITDCRPYETQMLKALAARADGFDVLHFHTDAIHLPLARKMRARVLTTLHGRLDLPGLGELYAEYREMPLVSISDRQRAQLPGASWAGTVHHGIPAAVCPFNRNPAGNYVAFLGRISPEKRVDRAIRIARAAGVPLRIAAKIDPADRQYYESRVRPLMRGSGVEFIGEIDEQQKAEFLGNARALLWPIDWPEPFGLAMIEAMSSGTPVIAWDEGSSPEVVDQGVTGFIVGSINEAVKALRAAEALDRRIVRDRFEQRFTAERMAHDYLEVYRCLSPQLEKYLDVGSPFPIEQCDGDRVTVSAKRDVQRAAADTKTPQGDPVQEWRQPRPVQHHGRGFRVDLDPEA